MKTTRPPLALRTADDMLSHVAGAEDRETWLSVGMALKAEFGDDAFLLWDRWAQDASNYSAQACRTSWRGFKSRAGGYTIATLVKHARDGGYRFDQDAAALPDAAELAQRRAERQQRLQTEHEQRQRLQHCAHVRASAQWKLAQREGKSAYLERKGIFEAESCRYLPAAEGGGIMLPMLRYDLPRSEALRGLQIIQDTGSKKYSYGMDKPGTACRLGLLAVGDPVFICEGYATGMTLRMATGRRFAVFVAFDAYNLPIVVDMVYRTNPQNPIVICADDDHATLVNGMAHNTGRIQAQIAMDSLMAEHRAARKICRTYPFFKKNTARGPKDSDFNDLHRLEGLGEVTAQMELNLDILEIL